MLVNIRKQYRSLTEREEMDLVLRSQSGDEKATELLILHNLQRVFRRAIKFYPESITGIDIEDLMQVGCMGVLEAIEKFDPSRGANFRTLAHWYIMKHLKKAVQRSHLMYNQGLMEDAFLLRHVISKLAYKGIPEQEITVERLAEETGLSVQRIKEVTSQPRLVYANEMLYSIPCNSREIEEIEEMFTSNQLRKIICDILRDKPHYVDHLYSHFVDGKKKTTIAKEYDISPEAIRVQINRAIKRLQSPVNIKKIKSAIGRD